MNFKEKNIELKTIIYNELSKIILEDCCLLGLPYFHKNVGDFLIWQGVENLLKDLNIRCTYRASFQTFDNNKINSNMTILLNGGGNFGDIWINNQNFRKKIINDFPNNKIIILPQTIYYFDENLLLYDAELFSKHKKLYICARDVVSYNILEKNFNLNRILLIPDLAFYIPLNYYNKYKSHNINNNLFLKRNDIEFNNKIEYSKYIDENIEILDWITFNKDYLSFIILHKLINLLKKYKFVSIIIDIYSYYLYKNIVIKQGVKFIIKYNKIYTTRLHGAILSCLLNKPFILFNNSYGKNKTFYKTWFKDLDNTLFYESYDN